MWKAETTGRRTEAAPKSSARLWGTDGSPQGTRRVVDDELVRFSADVIGRLGDHFVFRAGRLPKNATPSAGR